jgi:drug/metabolite transporter (DMT)-like permease
MVLFGALSMLALFCVNGSLKRAPASVVVPYQYTNIVWGTMLGYMVFDEVPNLLTIVGAVVIISAGLYIFWLEQAQS